MRSPQNLIRAARFSGQGLKSAWRTEEAFRADVLVLVLSQLFCAWMQPPLIWWLLLLLMNVLLLVVELLNTGLEYLVDFVSLEHHQLLGAAKDVGSAAVMLMVALNLITLVLVFIMRQ